MTEGASSHAEYDAPAGTEPGRGRGPRPWLLARAALLWASLLGAVGFLAVNGRPIADDYCNANRAASLGILGAATDTFKTWHGGWSADLSVSIFGRLIAELPFRWGYVPFALTTLALMVLCARCIAVSLGLGRGRDSSMWLLHVPLLTALLILGVTSTSRNQDLLFGTFLWQAASIVHVWPILLGLSLLSFPVEARRSATLAVDAALLVAAAVVVSFNFTETAVFGLTAGLMGSACALAALRVTHRAVLLRCARRYGGMTVVAIVGFAVMYLSPGTALRRELLVIADDGFEAKLVRFQDLATGLFYVTLGRHAVVFSLLTGLCLALLFRGSPRHGVDPARAATVAVLMVVTATLSTFVTAAGQLASYAAAWHALALIPLWVVTALAVGICLGAALPLPHGGPVRNRGLRAVAHAWPVVLVSLVVLHVAWYAEPLTARSATWDAGAAAPIAGAADRETEWINVCWGELHQARMETAGR